MIPVPHYEVPKIWPKVRGYLIPAIERDGGRQSEATVFESLISRDYQLWLVESAAVITTIPIYPTGLKAVRIIYAGGSESRAWAQEVADVVMEWGRQQGCSKLEIAGREGWFRLVEGLKKGPVILERDIVQG